MTDEKRENLFTDAAAYTFLFAALAFGIAAYIGNKDAAMYKLAAEEFALGELRATQNGIDFHIQPQIRDINSDGVEDIVLKRNNCEELVLYGTREGNYVFGKEDD